MSDTKNNTETTDEQDGSDAEYGPPERLTFRQGDVVADPQFGWDEVCPICEAETTLYYLGATDGLTAWICAECELDVFEEFDGESESRLTPGDNSVETQIRAGRVVEMVDSVGTTIWIRYLGEDTFETYIRNRERYERDIRKNESHEQVRELLSGAKQDARIEVEVLETDAEGVPF